jgi:hypothetical protein
MRLLEFFGLREAERYPQHSPHCVCKGKGWIWEKTHGTTGLNGSTPIQGNVKVPCPYGDLKINQPSAPVEHDPEDWDF